MSALGGFLANIRAGLRLAFFLPARLEELRASPLMLAALCACALPLQFAEDFSTIGLEGQFTPNGLQGTLFLFVVLLLLAALACGMVKRAQDTLPLATALAALALPILAIELAMILALPEERLAQVRISEAAWTTWQWAFPAWIAFASAVAAARLLRPGRMRGAAIGVLAALVVAVPLATVMQDRALWIAATDDDALAARKAPSAAREEVIYRQSQLLQEAFARLLPQRPDAIDLYYIGFGGYAQQDVFMREVRTVEQQMTEHFNLQGRTLSLLNNPKTALDLPIASVTGLRMALKHFGATMDPEQDILFLFLTSHGQKDHRLSLEFWPLQFIDLKPDVLRHALDESGIKWRVVVVSACYSGGFVEKLKDEHTIVLTAAAADKTSFGCTNEADWTYFGRAFFDEAFRADPRLVEAFEKAKVAIAHREEREGQETRSEPQIAAGRLMVDKWNAYLRQVAAASR